MRKTSRYKARELTPQEAALTSPLEYKTPLSLPWCYQFICALQSVWARKNFTEQYWKERLAEFAKHEPWNVYPPDRPYGSLDALLKAEIGVDVNESIEEIKLKQNGGDRRSDKFQPDTIRVKYGDDPAYLSARLERDHKEFYLRLKAGKFKSVRQAAKEAGIVRERISIALDPIKAAEAIFRHFSLREAEAASDRLSDLIAEAKGEQ